MGYPKFVDIFGAFIEKAPDAVKNAILEFCEIDSDTRVLTAKCYFDEYITREQLGVVSEEISKGLKMNGVHITPRYNSKCYSSVAAEDIATELRATNAMFNGYFNSAEFNVSLATTEDETYTTNITLKFGGYKTICNCNFEREFSSFVLRRFGVRTNIVFDGQLEEPDGIIPEYKQEPIREIPVAQSAPAPTRSYDGENGGGYRRRESKPPEPKKITGLFIPDGTPIIEDSILQIYGSKKRIATPNNIWRVSTKDNV